MGDRVFNEGFTSKIEKFNFELALLLDKHYKNSNTFIPNFGRGFVNSKNPEERESVNLNEKEKRVCVLK